MSLRGAEGDAAIQKRGKTGEIMHWIASRAHARGRNDEKDSHFATNLLRGGRKPDVAIQSILDGKNNDFINDNLQFSTKTGLLR